MSNKRNLYKLDDFSIIASYFFLIIFLFQFRFLIEYARGSSFEEIKEIVIIMFQASPIKLGLLLFSAIFFQILGRFVRRKEKISLEIIDKLSSGGRYSLDSLAFEMGKSERSLRQILNDLAKIEEAGIAFDGVTIKRTHKRGYEEVAKKFNMNPGARQKSTPEPTTQAPHPHQHLNSEPKPTSQTVFSSPNKDKRPTSLPGFNPLLFFILFFVFWPAAFIYLARVVVKNSQKNAFNKK